MALQRGAVERSSAVVATTRWALLFAYALLLVVLSIDLILMVETPLLAEGPPEFEGLFFVRTALTALSSGLFVLAIANGRTSEGPRATAWASWGRLRWPPRGHRGRIRFALGVKELIVWAAVLLSVFFLVLFLSSPEAFHTFGSEDQPVENASAFLYFLGGGVFLWIFRSLGQTGTRTRPRYRVASLAFALVFSLIALEEVSWFQRMLSIETPALLETGARDELNLHNLATDASETVYYFSAFLFLVVLPFVHGETDLLKKYRFPSFFAPSLFVLFLGTLAVSYNYDMWNIVSTQLAFFLTLSILIYYAWRSPRSSSYLPLALVAVFGLTQSLFLIYGDRFVRTWDVTEYKELLIPLAFLMYSLEILHKTRESARPGGENDAGPG